MILLLIPIIIYNLINITHLVLMDKTTLIKNVQNEIKKIDSYINNFLNQDQIPKIDIDIVKSKLRNLYEELTFLEKINSETTEKPIQESELESDTDKEKHIEISTDFVDENKLIEKQEQIIIEEKIIPEKKLSKKEIKQEKKKSKIVVVRTKGKDIDNQQEIVVEPEKIKKKSESIKIEDKEKIKEQPEIKKEKTQKKVSTSKNKTIIADKFAEIEPSINELLADSQKAKDLATKLKDKPISNIKSAISINDKIWYVKELFNDDIDKYNNALQNINNMNDLDEALMFLNNNFEWDQEKESFKSFLELIFRRFIPNEG
ncbi:MAG: hypothetical protein KAT68_13010 [Bacteroidales bacterium]|nr:hypothetical protein [Bacteroidales bacterium]